MSRSKFIIYTVKLFCSASEGTIVAGSFGEGKNVWEWSGNYEEYNRGTCLYICLDTCLKSSIGWISLSVKVKHVRHKFLCWKQALSSYGPWILSLFGCMLFRKLTTYKIDMNDVSLRNLITPISGGMNGGYLVGHLEQQLGEKRYVLRHYLRRKY